MVSAGQLLKLQSAVITVDRFFWGLVEVPQEEAATYSLAYAGGLPGGFGGTQRALHFTSLHYYLKIVGN